VRRSSPESDDEEQSARAGSERHLAHRGHDVSAELLDLEQLDGAGFGPTALAPEPLEPVTRSSQRNPPVNQGDTAPERGARGSRLRADCEPSRPRPEFLQTGIGPPKCGPILSASPPGASRRRPPLAARPTPPAQVAAKLRVRPTGNEQLPALSTRPRLVLHAASEVVGRGLLRVLVPPPLHRLGVAPPAPARQPIPHSRIERKSVRKTCFSAPRAPFLAGSRHHSDAPRRISTAETAVLHAKRVFLIRK
jgi:hypothetical protein